MSLRKIDKIIIHCSDSDRPEHDNIDVIRSWHKQRQFKDIGYHYVIVKSGGIFIGRNIFDIGAHTLHHNTSSIGLCLTGRVNFSNEQLETLETLCLNLMAIFSLPYTSIYGHYEFNNGKTCPNISMEIFRSRLKQNKKGFLL